MNVPKISHKTKNKTLLSTEKILQNEKKRTTLEILKVYIEMDKKL